MGHIQSRCKALERPRIAAHHAIWRELLSLLARYSLAKAPDGTSRWTFPTSLGEDLHKEWDVTDILRATGVQVDDALLRQHVLDFLQRNTEKADANYECLRNEIENVDSEADDMPLPDTEPMNADPSSPCARRTTLTQQLETAYKWTLRRITPDLSRQDRSQQDTEAMITSFLRLRPDGVALNLSQHKVRILEFTRSMDTFPDWEERKDGEKMKRYEPMLTFANHLYETLRLPWRMTQTNFTIGVRGSVCTAGLHSFKAKLESLGVKALDVERIRKRIVHTTLEMHDLLLKSYFAAKHSKPAWLDLPKITSLTRSLQHQIYLSHVAT